MNNYHIYDEIGRGKFSVVYKGRKKKSFEYLAVKSVEKSRRKKILNEVKILHSLNNERILKFFNWYETRNHLWIIFEYCAGGSLNTIIEADKKLPEKVILEFAQDIIEALFYLHTNGVIYCDLKPHTVLFTEYGVLKLGDFGLARRVNELNKVEDIADKKGTPFYMAPELFQEDGVPSYYSDFWSLGCILYELATGQPPFVSNSLQDLVKKILNDNIPNLAGFSSDFNTLLSDLLQKTCSDRLSWSELLEHKVWGANSKSWQGSMPPHPLYEKYLQSKNLSQRTYISKPQHLKVLNIDVVRISQNIQKNLLKESRDYSQQDIQASDVKLAEKDQVFDFGEHKNEKEETEKAANDEETFEDDKKSEENTGGFRPMTIQKKVREITVDDKNGQKNNNSINTPSSKSLQNAPAVNELILHSSDTTVKPIVGNKEIDKPLELSFSVQTFQFSPLTQEEVLRKGESSALEEHFQEIFTALNTPAVDKQNLLTYFESLILNASVANKLINSVFVNYFIKILKNGKNILVKARVCSILGQLLRHSTLINNELSQSGLYQALSDQIKDKNEKLSRKAIAALGEYLFYAATQMDDSQSEWEIPASIFALIIRTTKSSDDEAVRYYACKTIENISAQSQKAGLRFSTNEVLITMINIYNTTKYECFKTSASVVISHTIRLNSNAISVFLEKFPIKNISVALSEEQPRIQQSFLTTLLYILLNEQRSAIQLSDDRGLLSNLVSLLESSAIVVRGKSLLVLYFMIRSNPRTLSKLIELKLFVMLEKLLRDSYKYVQHCMCYLLEILGENTLQGLRVLKDELKRNAKISSVQQTVVILNSPACSLKLPYAQCLKLIAECLTAYRSIEGLSTILNILDAISAHSKGITQNSEFVISSILPNLISSRNLNDTDLRFRLLKVFSDILIPFLYEESVYDPNLTTKPATRIINELILNNLFPGYAEFLNDVDPIPLYSLKLLSAILERSMTFVTQIKRLQLIPMIIQNFEGGNSKLNLHLISVVKRIIESHEVSLEELGQLGVIEKVSSVMRVIQEQDWCVEKMLDILYELLMVTTDTLRNKRNEQSIIKITEPLCENFISCTKILGFQNEPVRVT